MIESRYTVILDEPCAALYDAVGAFATVFVFRSSRGLLSSPLLAAEELHQALTMGKLTPPYVYAAASFGGFAALTYATRYLTTLAGLVLVDASHPDQTAIALDAIPASTPATPALASFKKHLQGFGPVWTEACLAIAAISTLGDLPMRVLAAGQPDMPAELSEATRNALTRCWHALQRRHAALSTRGELRIVPGAGHDLIRQAPDAVVAAIQELVTAAT
jgi:pimeloyl-ACP methyl ester carboxylesterase